MLFDLISAVAQGVADAASAFDLSSDTGEVVEFSGMVSLLQHFGFHLVFVLSLIHMLYFRHSKRAEYYFTFTLISVSIFLMIFLLGSVKIKVGFALGLFAIFGIIRYRTESMPVREMTYLFVIIAMSVINALSVQIDWLTLATVNIIFIAACLLGEQSRKMKQCACKFVKYDRIDLIKPAKREEMIADLEERLGVKIDHVDVGVVNFLKDLTLLKVYYYPVDGNEENSVDEMQKMPKD
ncbi:MAG: DUF4956 domain-containing protein [Bacteroidales bacterium]|nr:DUF4956 domain-containing protein [Bacteroidales bacterium]